MAETVYTLRINKKILESIVTFDCENDEDLKATDSVEGKDYASVIVVSGAKVTYTVSCNGYETVSNTLIINKDITLTPDLKKLVKLTIIAEPSDAEIIFNYKNKEYKQSSIEVLTSTPVKYTVQKRNRQTVSDTIILERDTTLKISLSLSLETDGDIAKYEADNSDALSNIHLISQKDYDNLTDDLRSKYIKYNDLLSRFLGVDYNLTLNDCIVQLYWMLPIVHKLTPFTNGTLGNFQSDFITYLSQLNTLFAAADGIGDKLNSVRSALNKAGLDDLIDIFTTGFGLIGGLAGIVYGIMNNPDIFIKTYWQAFQDIDLQDIYNRTIKETLPNLDYLKGMLNRTYIPDGNLKKNLFDRIDQINAAADLSLDVLADLTNLKTMVNIANSSEDAMRTLIENLSTFSLQWALGALSNGISRLRLDKDRIKSNSSNNNLADAYNVMKENLDKILNQGDYYIHEDDLINLDITDNTTSTQKIMDYQNGYNDAFQNAQNGETEEEKNIRLARIKAEMERLGKDPSEYIYGYNIGWISGNRIYRMRENNFTTENQEESYNNGYADGYNFRGIVKDLAEDSIQMGYLQWFIDVDWHLHTITMEPFGRIDLKTGIVYDFHEDMTENPIGTYNKETSKIYITSENKYYLTVSNRYAYDTSREENKNVNEIMNLLYGYNLMRVERNAPGINLNPYYANGWIKGYNDRIIEQENESILVNIQNNGETDGYNNCQLDKTFSDCNTLLNEYQEEHPDEYNYYARGFHSGYNKYQAEYNTTYNRGWLNSMRPDEYQPGEIPEEAKINFLKQICVNYNLNYNEQIELPENQQSSYYRGAYHGWTDKYNNLENPVFREYFY